MLKIIELLLLVLILMAISCMYTTTCYANSAEPPSILVIVPNSPADLEISIENVRANRTNKGIESYYTFYRYDLKSNDYTMTVTTGGRSFKVVPDTPLQFYNNVFTLDLERQTLTAGKSLFRSITLVSLRIVLTLILEGIVFYLFGFRSKRSWLIFLIVNLLTQGILNIWLNTFMPFNDYIILSLIFGEILVFIIEMIAFMVMVKEHSHLRIGLYVVVANLLSLIAGGYLITLVPI